MNYKVKMIMILAIIYLSTIACQVTVLGPPTLVSKLKNYDTGSGLEYQLGNFGVIPYGKTSVGYVFYHKNTDGKNTWCDFETTSTPMGIENVPDGEYSPIFIVDYSSDCSMTRKAYNVKARGGRIMLVVSDDRSFKEYANIDDKLGDRIDIATVIIRKDEGEDIKTFMSNNVNEKVVMSIKFSGNKNDVLNIDFYLKSDDVKSLHFFTEFYHYYKKLKNKLNFTPHYKYMKYSWETTSNSISAANDSAPCIKETKYCAHSNIKLKITNPRVVLLENLRQSCIFNTFRNENMDLYWDYVKNFSETCVDLNNLLFTEECANDVMKYTGIDKSVINKCMEDAVKSVSGPIENDYQHFNSRKVHRVPEIRLNGVKYRGSWLASNIFNAICSGFIDNDSICATPKPEDLPSNNEGLGAGAIFLIAVAIILAMLVLLICYKRIVNKSLEASLNEKIQSQTIHSLGQYQVFKDESTGRKTVDVSKL